VSELIGSRISHYRIVSLLGVGGMGAVYRAHDERLERDLALKVLPPETMADATARARLLHEARMASSLNHPHIAQVYEVGEDEGRVYIALELVEGRTLSAQIPPTGFPPETMLRNALQIADALAYAHEHGVIHRDLKSANIMLTAEGRVKILDFGLAKRVRDAGSATPAPDLNLTATGIVVGTPNHLPPEVLGGAPADARSDVWALGVVLYEMASGKFPFKGGTMAELADAIQGAPPTPMSERVPVGIRAVIQRCLAKEPARRYQNASEVRAAIEAVQQAIVPRSTRGPFGISRGAWLAAAAVLIIAPATIVLLVRQFRHGSGSNPGHPHIASIAVLPLVNLSGDPAQEYFADGMTEELITSLAPIQSLKVISRTSVMRYKNSQEPLKDIARELGVDAIVEGSVQRAGDRVRITAQLIEASSDRHLWARSFDRDFKDVLTIQSDVARDIAQEVQLQLSPQVEARLASPRQINPRAYEFCLKGRFEWNKLTDEGGRKAIGYYEQALALDPNDPRANSGLADAYLVLTQVVASEPAREGMAKVKEYAGRALAADENSAEAHASYAAALFFGDWDFKGGEREVRRSIELNSGYPAARIIYSTILIAQGRVDEALEQDKKAMELDPLSTIINWNSIGTLVLAHRFDAALVQARHALEVSPEAELLYGSFLRIYEDKGDYEAALDIREKHLPERFGGPRLAAAVRRAYVQSGPKGYWQAVLAYLQGQGQGAGTLDVALAYLYTRLDDHARALTNLEHAYSIRSGDMLYLKVEPGFDALHDEPRFQALVRRVGIP
jgi:serine/threonine protein kinase/tetratricopeptide (TPR) repeat protein